MSPEGQSNTRKRKTLVRAKLDKLEFPEICPVCMSEAEDLVSIIVYEHSKRFEGNSSISGTWSRGEDKTGVALAQAQGALSFWVPACMKHGSILTRSKAIISIIGLMVLFYPFLYFMMGISVAVQFSRPIEEPLLGLATLLLFMVLDILYGFYPRVLQRKIKFIKVNRAKNEVFLEIHHTAYLEQFISLNEMHVDIVKTID